MIGNLACSTIDDRAASSPSRTARARSDAGVMLNISPEVASAFTANLTAARRQVWASARASSTSPPVRAMNLHVPPRPRVPLGEKLRRVNQHALGLRRRGCSRW